MVQRVRRLFDLDADPLRIATDLGRDPDLARLVAARPGVRVPGAWDPFELAVRAVLGQQVSVKGATTLAGRLVQTFGKPVETTGSQGLTHRFPRADELADADLSGIGLPRARAATVRALAGAVASGELSLEGPGSLDAMEELRSIEGVGDWTAQYVAMRALNEPDAFPAGDLGLRRAVSHVDRIVTAAALARRAEAWRPWRAYAAMWLWTSGHPPPA